MTAWVQYESVKVKRRKREEKGSISEDGRMCGREARLDWGEREERVVTCDARYGE